jgi:GNAT superfamily N-acetyltransferase
MVDWTDEPLGRDHDRSGFVCGRPSLDDFIRARVSRYERRRLGETFVAVPLGQRRVIGYQTLAASAVAFEHLPSGAARGLPRHPVPVVLLARLAVDRSVQEMRLGEGLLLDALQRALDLSRVLGVHAVGVDAIDDSAAAFYRRYGFTALLHGPLHLYLPISTMEKVLG